jgi:WD40 repeat protein
MKGLKNLGQSIYALAFSPDGTRLATNNWDSHAWGGGALMPGLWDVTSGQQLGVPVGDGELRPLAFSPDGTRMAARRRDGTTWLCDVATGKAPVALTGEGQIIQSLEFSPDATRLVTEQYDSRDPRFRKEAAILWDAVSGEQVAVLGGYGGGLTGVAYSPDRTRLVTVSRHRITRLWDAASGEPLATLEYGGAIRAVAFSPDATQLAIGMRVWDIASRKQLALLGGHSQGINAVAFSPDGTRLVTASADKTARIWDVVSGRPLAVLEGHGQGINAVAFSPDGTRLATVSSDKTVRLWGLSSAEMYRVRRETAVIERRLDERIATWMNQGPEATIASVKAARAAMTPEEYRVAGNMILSRLAAARRGLTDKYPSAIPVRPRASAVE